MDKVVASPQEALADMEDGATVAIGGFSVGHRFALSLITALRDKGTRDLCLVCNSMGAAGELRGLHERPCQVAVAVLHIARALFLAV